MSSNSDTESTATTESTKRLSLRREAVRIMGVRSGIKTGTQIHIQSAPGSCRVEISHITCAQTCPNESCTFSNG